MIAESLVLWEGDPACPAAANIEGYPEHTSHLTHRIKEIQSK
jgi:hypothetical protein